MKQKHVLGWREWVSLPSLGVEAVKAKVDTGARTCALHAYYIEPFERNKESWVRFGLHPNQGDTDTALECEAKVSDRRSVTDSGGHAEERYIINTAVVLNDVEHAVEITLTNRDSMRFRMLLGRNLIAKGYVVDPTKSYLLGKLKPSATPGNGGEYNENEDNDSEDKEEE